MLREYLDLTILFTLSYRTCIYELYEELILDEYLDILLILKKYIKQKRKDLFNKNYTDINLIFDFEAQYQKSALKNRKNALLF